MVDDNAPILIKRYASRRLYNTNTSDYVTLDEVAQFIRDGRDVKIVDRKTGTDLTRQYLLQIIIDYETRGENVLPINVLTDIVRSYNDQAQNFIPDFLSQSYEMLKQQQSLMMSALPPQVKETLPQMDGLEQWQKMQSEFLNNMMGAWTGARPAAEEKAKEEAETKDAEEKTTKPTPARKSRTTGAKKSTSAKKKSSPTQKADTKEKEIDEIRKQLVELQSKLQDL